MEQSGTPEISQAQNPPHDRSHSAKESLLLLLHNDQLHDLRRIMQPIEW